MSNFSASILKLLKHEGGYNNIKEDKGGATNFGISLRFLKLIDEDVDGDGHVDIKDIQAMTEKTAAGFYKEHFWDHYKLGEIRDVNIARKALDLFVNMRGNRAARIIQQAVSDDKTMDLKIKVDGILGAKSFAAINELARDKIKKAQLLERIKIGQGEFYRAIVAKDKSQAKFLKGWLRRAAG